MTDPSALAGGDLAPPIDDPVYRAVVAARDPVLLRGAILDAWKRAGVEPEPGITARVILAHYKPRSRARLIVSVEIARPAPKRRPKLQYLYIQAYPTLAAARRRFAHVDNAPLRCVGPAVFLLEDWSSVAWALPNGPMLRTTKMMLRRRTFGRFLAEAGLGVPEGQRTPRPPKLIRYVPRRRALFRLKRPVGNVSVPIYIKIYSPGQDEPAARNLAMAARAAAGSPFSVPPLIAHVRRRRALWMEEIPGRRLSDHDMTLDAAAFHAVGRALAALHASDIRPAAEWSAEREVGALRTAMDDVVLALPAMEPRLLRLVDEIDRRRGELQFPSDRPIHGNMFGDQVLVDADLRVGIVDWDDLCVGDPLFDLGRLVASALFLAQRRGSGSAGITALLAGYAEGGGSIDRERLGWHVATALLLRAKISALRPLPASWMADIQHAVELTTRILGGAEVTGLDLAWEGHG